MRRAGIIDDIWIFVWERNLVRDYLDTAPATAECEPPLTAPPPHSLRFRPGSVLSSGPDPEGATGTQELSPNRDIGTKPKPGAIWMTP